MKGFLANLLSLRVSLALKIILALFLLWSIPAKAAEIVEYITPTKNSSPADLAFDPQGNLWFTELHGNKIGKLTPSQAKPGTSDGITEYELPTPGSKPWYILISHDGFVWFSAWGTNSIGRLDPKSGAITEFTVPTPDSEPHKLKEHADGSIWFTEFEANKIGRLDPATGEIREFEINAGHPHGLILGRGKVWYSQAGKFWKKQFFNKIGSLDPETNQIKEIVIPPKNSVPHGMTQSANGDIWFTQFFAKKISRLDFSSGGAPKTVDYSLGEGGGTPHDLLVDDSRDVIWYADNHGDHIGRLDLSQAQPGTSNGVETFKVPTQGAHPSQLALDADGNVWFTEMGMYFRGRYQNKIGKLTP